MKSEAQIVISFIFNRTGKERLSFSEMYLTMSMNLNWCNPKQAKDFIKKSIEKRLLIEEKGHLKPTFNLKEVEIPVGFKPSEGFFKTSDLEPIKKEENKEKHDLIKIIAEKTDNTLEEINKIIEKNSNEKNIYFEIAALIYAREINIDISEYAEEIEKSLFT